MKKYGLLLGISILGAFCFSGLASAGNIKGKVSLKKSTKPQVVLVYINKVEGIFKPSSDIPNIDQKNVTFIPHLLPVLAGTTVQFRNSDIQKHNVFGSGSEEFNLGTWYPGITKPYVFKKPGVTTLLCNVHSEMEAHVVALQNPYFALTDEQGNFLIQGVPAGNYQLKTWHERLKPAALDVSVPADKEVEVNFDLSK